MPNSSPNHPPPFCPNPKCESRATSTPWRFKKKGFYARTYQPYRVQRYLCHHCHRNFSSQTFSTTYWLRYTDLLELLFHRLVGGSCLRQISRELGITHSALQHQTERLGRHCLLFHEQLRPKRAPDESLVLDGFRTFEHSQYWPFDLNLLIGTSHFVYGMGEAELRRSGTMRPAQREKRTFLEAKHGRPFPQATRRSVAELVARIVPEGGEATIRSDEHQAYPRAFQRLKGRRLHHEQTSSRKSRTTRNPLFPVNLADLLLRHSSANHKRETIAFSKRRQGAMYRAAIWVVWRNYVKSRSENKKNSPPAVVLGLIRKRISIVQILEKRLFPSQMNLSSWVRRCYEGRISTRRLEKNRIYQPAFAE
jgi:transposase-like protein